jgi:hypothetical protein
MDVVWTNRSGAFAAAGVCMSEGGCIDGARIARLEMCGDVEQVSDGKLHGMAQLCCNILRRWLSQAAQSASMWARAACSTVHTPNVRGTTSGCRTVQSQVLSIPHDACGCLYCQLTSRASAQTQLQVVASQLHLLMRDAVTVQSSQGPLEITADSSSSCWVPHCVSSCAALQANGAQPQDWGHGVGACHPSREL